MMVSCGHCGEIQPYNGKGSYKNCRKCGYKIYFTQQNTNVDTYIAQGLTKLEIRLKTEQDRIRIVPWGDIHIGAPKGQCDFDKALSNLQYISDTPDTYLLGMGDYMDCAQKMPWQRGPNLFISSLTPMEQFTQIEQALKPLAEKGKILGLHGGNHEDWIMQTTGIQIIDLLCRSLRVPFLGPGCDLVVHVNRERYLGYSQHGTSNARLKHTKLGALMSATKDIFADFFLYGHTHQIGVSKGGKRLCGRQAKAYYVLTGHYLDWEGSYAQAFGLDVCPSGSPLIKLFSERRDVHVSI